MWLNWLVLTGWNVGCLPLAFLITATHARRRVMAAVKLGTDGSKQKDSEEPDSLSDLGNVALMGA